MSIHATRIHVYKSHTSKWIADATLEVDGLGEVRLQHAISDELIERIKAESVVALQIKIGQVVEAERKGE